MLLIGWCNIYSSYIGSTHQLIDVLKSQTLHIKEQVQMMNTDQIQVVLMLGEQNQYLGKRERKSEGERKREKEI